MKITMTSLVSGKQHTRDIDVTDEQLRTWRRGGVLIQDAMPQLSADDREFLMTGIIPEEWAEEFGEGDESRGEEDD